jgi:hypothetical protein
VPWAKAIALFLETSGIWAAVKVISTALYIYSLWTSSQQRGQSPTYDWGAATQSNNNIPIPILDGKVKCAGNIVWRESIDNGKTVKMFVAFASQEIQGFEDIRVNDIPIGNLPGCSYTAYLGTKTQELDPRCWQTYYPEVGHWETVDIGPNVWVVDTPAYYTGNPAIDGVPKCGGMRNVAYLAMTLQASDKLSGGNPNITAVVSGRKVRVWNGASWVKQYSENPAFCYLDFLTDSLDGAGYTDDQINLESFKSSATYCDYLVSSEPRFTLDLIIDSEMSVIDVQDQIRMTCQGYTVEQAGKLSFLIEQPSSPVQAFDMNSIVPSSLQISIPGIDEIYDLVNVNYVEPSLNWAKVPATYVSPSNPLYPVKQNYDIVGVTRFKQASRLAYYYWAYANLCQKAGVFKTTIRALNRTPGDVITITEDVMGWINKPVRIMRMREAADHTAEIFWKEYNGTIYTDQLGSALPTTNYSELPNAFAPPANPTNLVIIESTFILASGGVVTEIIVTFTPSYSQFYAYTEITISTDGGLTYSDFGISHDGKLSKTGFKVGVTYNFILKTVSLYHGVKSAGLPGALTTIGKNYPPSDVPNMYITQTDEMLNFTIVEAADPDIDYYTIMVGPSWNNSAVFKEKVPRNQINFEQAVTQEGTYTFWVKAFDTSGKQSVNAKGIIYTVIGIQPKNIMVEREENISTWKTIGMCRCPYSGCIKIDSVQTVGDYEFFAEIFDNSTVLRTDAEAIPLPLDIGAGVIEENSFFYDGVGTVYLKDKHLIDEYIEFFDMFIEPYDPVTPQYKLNTKVTMTVKWAQQAQNFIKIEHRESFDGVNYGAWIAMTNHAFFGRFIWPRLLPGSKDGVTNVSISGAHISIDVPDISEKIPITTVAASGTTRYYMQKRFFNITMPPELSSLDSANKSCSVEIVGGVSIKDPITGIWYFDVKLWSLAGVQVAGKIWGRQEGY